MRPCPMMEYPSLPTPVSRKRSTTSLSRQLEPFNSCSLSPLRYTRRVMLTSAKSTGSWRSALSNTRVTSQ